MNFKRRTSLITIPSLLFSPGNNPSDWIISSSCLYREFWSAAGGFSWGDQEKSWWICRLYWTDSKSNTNILHNTHPADNHEKTTDFTGLNLQSYLQRPVRHEDQSVELPSATSSEKLGFGSVIYTDEQLEEVATAYRETQGVIPLLQAALTNYERALQAYSELPHAQLLLWHHRRLSSNLWYLLTNFGIIDGEANDDVSRIFGIISYHPNLPELRAIEKYRWARNSLPAAKYTECNKSV